MNAPQPAIRHVNITRYVTPLREGGSMPAITEADDGFLYVVKFRGAGQGVKALIAELIGGEIARALGLRIPEIVFATLDEGFGRTEPDEEIQDLMKASAGLNLGLHYLSGSISYDPVVNTADAITSSTIVWLDSFITNMDRTARNTNMLVWNKELWLIDHGASFYFHHGDKEWNQQASNPFELIKDHVLLGMATSINEADQQAVSILGGGKLEEITNMIPDDWLMQEGQSPQLQRQAYKHYLQSRLENSHVFVNEINHARKVRI